MLPQLEKFTTCRGGNRWLRSYSLAFSSGGGVPGAEVKSAGRSRTGVILIATRSPLWKAAREGPVPKTRLRQYFCRTGLIAESSPNPTLSHVSGDAAIGMTEVRLAESRSMLLLAL